MVKHEDVVAKQLSSHVEDLQEEDSQQLDVAPRVEGVQEYSVPDATTLANSWGQVSTSNMSPMTAQEKQLLSRCFKWRTRNISMMLKKILL